MRRIVRWCSSVVTGGGHEHDQIDDAVEANAAGRRALVLSLVALLLLTGLQAVVVVVTGSAALLGDTLHSLSDALVAVPLLVAFALSRRAATKRFTYGFGRAEDVAGLFVVLMIAVSAGLTAVTAIRRFAEPQEVQHVWAVALAGLVGMAGNELIARYRIRVGRRIGSAALVAEGLHARVDGLTSLAVVVSALGVWLGYQWADPVVGLLIAVAILAVLRTAVVQVGSRIMDAVEPGLVDRATAAVASVGGVRDVHDLRIRWVGHALRAEVSLCVDPELGLREAHDLAHRAENTLLEELPRLAAATVHVVPDDPPESEGYSPGWDCHELAPRT